MKIVRITTERFFDPTKGGYLQPKGQYCLKDDRGYLAYTDNKYKPYFPNGGKKVLVELLQDKGFLTDPNLIFIQAMHEPVPYAHGA